MPSENKHWNTGGAKLSFDGRTESEHLFAMFQTHESYASSPTPATTISPLDYNGNQDAFLRCKMVKNCKI